MYITKKPTLWSDLLLFVWSMSLVLYVYFDLLHDDHNLWGTLLIWFEIACAAFFVLKSVAAMISLPFKKRRYDRYANEVQQLLWYKNRLASSIKPLFAKSKGAPCKFEYDDGTALEIFVRDRSYVCILMSDGDLAYNPETMRNDLIRTVREYTVPVRGKYELVLVKYDGVRVEQTEVEQDECNWFVPDDPHGSDYPEALSIASDRELRELQDSLKHLEFK